jgi:hypothetical protein
MVERPEVIKDALLLYAEEELDYPFWNAFLPSNDVEENYSFDIDGLGEVRVIASKDYDSHKTYDNWYEDLWIVFDVKGVLYRIKGTYTSYAGSEWEDNMTVVVPKLKTVIEYEDSNGLPYIS